MAPFEFRIVGFLEQIERHDPNEADEGYTARLTADFTMAAFPCAHRGRTMLNAVAFNRFRQFSDHQFVL
ncbi:MAG: hypothetical protein M3451_02885 [Chloroflexota bacterium]|nr:hypothetical protein [Chloroflexota bacterium]